MGFFSFSVKPILNITAIKSYLIAVVFTPYLARASPAAPYRLWLQSKDGGQIRDCELYINPFNLLSIRIGLSPSFFCDSYPFLCHSLILISYSPFTVGRLVFRLGLSGTCSKRSPG
jgi:hypothetical protein